MDVSRNRSPEHGVLLLCIDSLSADLAKRYQEEHFACRTLVFASGTARLRCRSEVSFAESRFEDKSIVDKVPAPSYAGTNNDIGEIEGCIQGYSERHLTWETDIYRAFAGVGRQIQVQLQCDLCHGIPTGFFDWFLLWQPLSYEPVLVRRPVAPSWSWAGWRGAVVSFILGQVYARHQSAATRDS